MNYIIHLHMFACWVTTFNIYCKFLIFKKYIYISVDNVEHTTKLDIYIADAIVHANYRKRSACQCQAGQMYIVTHLTFKISLIRINSQQSNIDYHNLQIGHSQNGLYWCFFPTLWAKISMKYSPHIYKTIIYYMPEFVSARPFHLRCF